MLVSRTHVTVILGIAQTLAWASSYYLLAVLAESITQAIDISYGQVFAAFSAALLVAAAVGPYAGSLIDRFGGRWVLIFSNLIFALGLLILSQATQTLHVFIAWVVIGVAMGSGLYEAAFASLVGPAQVAGRLIEYSLLRKAHPLFSARLAILAHPLAAIILLLIGAPAVMGFAVLHGLGNGILTIAIGTLPLKLFGAEGYGQRQGWLMAPARVVQAGAPLLFGLVVADFGSHALWLSMLLGLSAFYALARLSLRT